MGGGPVALESNLSGPPPMICAIGGEGDHCALACYPCRQAFIQQTRQTVDGTDITRLIPSNVRPLQPLDGMDGYPLHTHLNDSMVSCLPSLTFEVTTSSRTSDELNLLSHT